MNSFIKRIGQSTIVPRISVRQLRTNAEIVENCSEVQNRNPRNLELLTIARKPTGFHLDNPGREFWHKLIVTKSSRHVTVDIVHFQNKVVVTASTKEWAIKKQLYSPQDSAAYLNLGRVIAQRCLESGIVRLRCDIKSSECVKVNLLLSEVAKEGVELNEPQRYEHAAPTFWDRPEKPWEIED